MHNFDEFLSGIGNFHELCEIPSKLVPFFGYYLETAEAVEVLTPKAIAACYEAARLNPPVNLSDVLRKSTSFIQVKGRGYRLSRAGRDLVQRSLVASGNSVTIHEVGFGGSQNVSANKVLVVYGRDEELRIDFFSLLRTLRLHPLEFEEMVQLTGKPTPHVWEVILTAFKHVQACIVLITPDEIAHLREDLQSDVEGAVDLWQPRPNVLVEAGVALALDANRTLIVRIGHIRDISDLAGQHYLAFDGSAQSRHRLVKRLGLAKCEVDTTGQDWLSVGKFNVKQRLGG